MRNHFKIQELSPGVFFYESTRDADLYQFRTPSLRNIGAIGPYFHDGRAQTLTQVVDFYAKGGDPETLRRKARAVQVRPLDLSAEDKAALVEFLQSLQGSVSDGF